MRSPNFKLTALVLALALVSSASIAAKDTKPIAAAEPAPKNITPSSARTVKELIEIDDRLALNKERNALLTEQVKTREIDPSAKKPEELTKLLHFERTAIAAEKKSAEMAASDIVVTSIMGVDGSRVVDGTIGLKHFSVTEGKGTDLGWRVSAIRGQCADFEKLMTTQSAVKEAKQKNSKVDLVKSETKTSGERKTACFTQATFQSRSYGPSGLRIPVPLPAARPGIPMPMGSQ